MCETATVLPFWERLTEQEKVLCTENSLKNRYAAGSYLLSECGGRSCLGMLHVLSGEIRVFILSEEGREITLFRLRAGDNCVLSASCVLSKITFATQLCVTRDAETLILPSSVFGKLMANNIYVRCFTYELATERFSTVMWVMQQIIFFGFDKRLAYFLLEECRRTDATEILMTQEEIAVATNSAREVVARMLKHFSEDGLIECKRGKIVVTNLEGLRKINKEEEK